MAWILICLNCQIGSRRSCFMKGSRLFKNVRKTTLNLKRKRARAKKLTCLCRGLYQILTTKSWEIRKRKRKKLLSCLYTDWNAFHFLKGGTIASEIDRIRLLEKLRLENEKKKGQGALQISPSIQPLSEDGWVSSVHAVPGNALKMPSIVMVYLGGWKVDFLVESGADQLANSDASVNVLNSKQIFLSILIQAQTFKAVNGSSVRSPSQIEISQVLSTSSGKSCPRNSRMDTVLDEDTTVWDRVTCSGEIVLGNPFFRKAGPNIADFIAENLERRSSVDYYYVHNFPDGQDRKTVCTGSPSWSWIRHRF